MFENRLRSSIGTRLYYNSSYQMLVIELTEEQVIKISDGELYSRPQGVCSLRAVNPEAYMICNCAFQQF